MTYFIGIRIDDTDTFESLPEDHPEYGDDYGHAMLTLTDEAGNTKVFDMMPEGWPSRDPITGALDLSPSTGHVRLDAPHGWNFEKRTPISASQYAQILSYAESMQARALLYHAFPATVSVEAYSCISFVAAAYEIGGISTPGMFLGGGITPAWVPRLDVGYSALALLSGVDIPSGAVDTGAVTIIHAAANPNGSTFGTGGSDLILNYGGGIADGRAGNDTLSGGSSRDTLRGGAGQDSLKGGDGDDILEGGDDGDTLEGGVGDDQLKGGVGSDRYKFGATFGSDTVEDTDGLGAIEVTGTTLTGGRRYRGEAVYRNRNNGSSYLLVGTTLYVMKQGASGAITIKDWSNGQLGIRLVEEIPIPLPASPIILDLDGNGIDTTSVSSGAHFDHSGDGFREATGWIGANDGFLVRDLNGNGLIDSGSELFGSYTLLGDNLPAPHGFAVLSELDSNGNGYVNEADPAFSSLRIWRDINQDGLTGANELMSLSDANVAAIGTGFSTSNYIDVHGNAHRQVGSFIDAGGVVKTATDVWFNSIPSDTIASEILPVTAEIAALPDLGGSGTTHSLHQAMVRDPQLLALVQNFVSAPSWADAVYAARDLIWRWTGSDVYAPDSRGTMRDARWLYMLEALWGSSYVSTRGTPSPWGQQGAAVLVQSAGETFSSFFSQLMSQTHLRELMDLVSVTWDEGAQTFRAHYDDATAEIVALAAIDRSSALSQLSQLVQVLQGANMLTSQALSDLRSGVASLGEEATELVVERAPFPSGSDVLAWVFGGVEVFHGTAGNDSFLGYDGDDTLSGGAGDDSLSGGAGDDVLEGQSGNDTLSGGLGNDTYRFGRGDYDDTIIDYTSGPTDLDVLELGTGISPAGVRLSRADNQLILTLVETGETLTVQDYFRTGGEPGWSLEVIRFADGTTWDTAYVSSRVIGPTAGNDFLYGNGANDTISALGGNDLLIGYAGLDLLDGGDGADTIDGGIGNDTLTGGNGADTFRYGANQDIDVVNGQRSEDVLVLASDISPTDVTVVRVGTNPSNLELVIRKDGEVEGRITLVNQASDLSAGVNGIRELSFADGTIWTHAQLRMLALTGDADSNNGLIGYATADLINGLGGNDYLAGELGADTLLGGQGNDFIVGGDDDDRIVGGRGNDNLAGQVGTDTYVFNRGDGQDTITPYGGASTGLDTLEFGAGILPQDVQLRFVGSDLYILLSNTDDSVRVFNYSAPQFRELSTLRFADGTIWSASYILEQALVATSANDTLTAYSGVANTVSGGDGNDTLYGGGISDTLDGGEGDDRISAGGAASTVLGGAGDDYISTGAGNDLILGGAGNDQLYDNGGNDTLDGGAGNDWLEGRAGNDTYRFGRGSGSDVIDNRSYVSDGAFFDRLELGAGIAESDVILTRAGDDLVLAIAGTDDVATLVNYFRAADLYDYQVDWITLAGGVSWDLAAVTARLTTVTVIPGTTIEGSASAEVLTGGAGNDTIVGDAGNDTIDGGLGSDRLDGGTGQDVFLINRTSGKDSIVHDSSGDLDRVVLQAGIAPGDVRVSYAQSGELVLSILGTATTLTGLAGVSQLSFADGTVWSSADLLTRARAATDSDDFLFGSSASDTLSGGIGDDWVEGQSGDDVLTGGRGDDVLSGGEGQDVLSGGDGADDISGGAGNDTLLGDIGNDHLYGGDGNDLLDGGAGNDTLWGDAGADRFVLRRTGGKDVLLVDAQDVIEVDAGIAPGDVVVTRQNDDLLVSIVGSSASHRVEYLFNGDEGSSYEGFTIRFADGTQWGLNEIKVRSLLAQEGSPNAITGYAASETIEGSGEADSIAGRAGDDAISGGAGVDVVNGDDGNDTLQGGLHNDSLYGGNGNDAVFGQDGDDTLYGGAGSDSLDGGYGRDWVYGDEGNDLLRGGANDDQLAAGMGDDLLQGDGGIDVLIGGGGDDTLDGGSGDDVNDAQEGNDTIRFGFGDGMDWIRSMGQIPAPGFDTLEFKSDVNPWDVWARRTNVSWTGGPGQSLELRLPANGDKITVDKFFANETVGSPDKLIQEVRFADGTVWDAATLVNLPSSPMQIGGDLAQTLTGTSSADRLYGLDGDDVIEGGLGNDWLDGGSGADTLIGGAGNDTYAVDSTADMLVEETGAGTDTVQSRVDYALANEFENLRLIGNAVQGLGNAANNRLDGNDRDNILDGRGGIDTFAGGGGNDTYFVDDTQEVVIELEGAGVDTVMTGSSYTLGNYVENLVLTGMVAANGTGNASRNDLTGNDAANRLDGGAGDDTLAGRGGNDIYVVDSAGDNVEEELDGGIDTVETAISYALTANVENLTLTSTQNWTVITGNALNNVILGNTGSDTLDGGAGADTLIGGAGYDSYVVDNIGDTIIEGAGPELDYVYASISWALGNDLEILQLTGSSAIDGTGNMLNNDMTGNAAANRLDGGAGDDVMRGGAGNDTFVVDSAGDSVAEYAGEGTDTVEASVSFTLASYFENLVLTGTAAISGTGNSQDNVLSGNAGANALSGANGNDTLDGGAGSDTLLGGAGNDLYVVESLGDVVTEAANAGTDTVRSSISWTLASNVEHLELTGASAINGTGNSSGNRLIGNSAANTLDGSTGSDTLLGGAGDDLYTVDVGTDVVTENVNEGTDTVQSSATHTLGANVENLTLTGSAVINGTGNTLNNVLIGNSGANRLDGGAGHDSMTGGAGNDTYVIDAAGDVVIEAASGGTDIVESSITWTLGGELENLTLTGANGINGTGNVLANTITGNGGANTLDGGAGTDTLVGGAGNDTYIVDATADVVTEQASAGTDLVQSSATYTLSTNVENLTLTGGGAIDGTGNTLTNVLTGNVANNTLNGGTGTDTLIGGAGNDTYVVDVTADVVTEAANQGIDLVQAGASYTLSANVENLTLTGSGTISGTGNELDNVLTGNSANNTLTGAAGNDTLDGGTGNDILVGGAGNDTYFVNVTADVVTELANEGSDTVQSAVTWSLNATANIENVTLTGSGTTSATGNAAANVLIGNGANNTLTGAAGDDTLDGGLGTDILVGGTGNDTYVVNVSSDVITENASEGTDTVQSAVTWTLSTNLENLTLTGSGVADGTGNASANVLTGNSANNSLSGLMGSDTLDGGAGNDTLNGGAAADTYLFARGYGQDTIQDNDTMAGVNDRVQFAAGIAQSDLTYRQVGNNLEASINGTTDKLIFQDWYLGSQNHVEEFRFNDGSVLTDAQVQGLVSAMAGFSAPAMGQTGGPTMWRGTPPANLAPNALM